MKTIYILLSLIIGCSLKAQPPIEWQRAYGGTGQDDSFHLLLTNDGGYLIGGRSSTADGDVTSCNGGADYWIVKTNSIGTIDWQKSIGGSGLDGVTSAKQTSDGGYLILGFSYSNDGDMTGGLFGVDVYLFKLTATGAIGWKKVIGGSGDDAAYSFEETSDGGYIVIGRTDSGDGDVNSVIHGATDAWVFKIDSTGQVVWSKTYGGFDSDIVYCIKATTDGGYVVAGYTLSTDGDVISNHGNADMWVFKIDSVGTMQWQKTYGTTGYDIAFAIEQTAEGGYIVAGCAGAANGDTTIFLGGGHDGWAVKLDSVGTIEWQKTMGGTLYEDLVSVKQTLAGDYLFLGQTNSNDNDVSGNHGNSDLWLVKLDNSGTSIEWQKTIGGSSYDVAHDLQLTPDGGCIVLGDTDSSDGDVTGNHGFTDILLVKLGNILATNSIDPKPMPLAYPNPFKDTLVLQSFTNSVQQPYTLYDTTGKEVLSGMIQEHNKTIDTHGLPAGAYFLKVNESKSGIKLIKR